MIVNLRSTVNRQPLPSLPSLPHPPRYDSSILLELQLPATSCQLPATITTTTKVLLYYCASSPLPTYLHALHKVPPCQPPWPHFTLPSLHPSLFTFQSSLFTLHHSPFFLPSLLPLRPSGPRSLFRRSCVVPFPFPLPCPSLTRSCFTCIALTFTISLWNSHVRHLCSALPPLASPTLSIHGQTRQI